MCYAYYILYESKDDGNDGYDNDYDDDCNQMVLVMMWLMAMKKE